MAEVKDVKNEAKNQALKPDAPKPEIRKAEVPKVEVPKTEAPKTPVVAPVTPKKRKGKLVAKLSKVVAVEDEKGHCHSLPREKYGDFMIGSIIEF